MIDVPMKREMAPPMVDSTLEIPSYIGVSVICIIVKEPKYT
jgi:hypothetical protein